jgi:hypothetical protein
VRGQQDEILNGHRRRQKRGDPAAIPSGERPQGHVLRSALNRADEMIPLATNRVEDEAADGQTSVASWSYGSSGPCVGHYSRSARMSAIGERQDRGIGDRRGGKRAAPDARGTVKTFRLS